MWGRYRECVVGFFELLRVADLKLSKNARKRGWQKHHPSFLLNNLYVSYLAVLSSKGISRAVKTNLHSECLISSLPLGGGCAKKTFSYAVEFSKTVFSALSPA